MGILPSVGTRLAVAVLSGCYHSLEEVGKHNSRGPSHRAKIDVSRHGSEATCFRRSLQRRMRGSSPPTPIFQTRLMLPPRTLPRDGALRQAARNAGRCPRLVRSLHKYPRWCEQRKREHPDDCGHSHERIRRHAPSRERRQTAQRHKERQPVPDGNPAQEHR